MALDPLVTGVHKGLEKCQRDDELNPERLPLPAPVALSNLEGADHAHAPLGPIGTSRPETRTLASFSRRHRRLHLFQSGRMQRPLPRGAPSGHHRPHHPPATGRKWKEGPPPGPPLHEANRMIRSAKSGIHATCLLRRRRHHGSSPHTPMSLMPRGG